jgi:hypothetical protein
MIARICTNLMLYFKSNSKIFNRRIGYQALQHKQEAFISMINKEHHRLQKMFALGAYVPN